MEWSHHHIDIISACTRWQLNDRNSNSQWMQRKENFTVQCQQPSCWSMHVQTECGSQQWQLANMASTHNRPEKNIKGKFRVSNPIQVDESSTSLVGSSCLNFFFSLFGGLVLPLNSTLCVFFGFLSSLSPFHSSPCKTLFFSVHYSILCVILGSRLAHVLLCLLSSLVPSWAVSSTSSKKKCNTTYKRRDTQKNTQQQSLTSFRMNGKLQPCAQQLVGPFAAAQEFYQQKEFRSNGMLC